MRQPVAVARAQYERFRLLIHEFAKFAVIGITGVFITNGVYDLLYIHLGVGPVTSATIATIVATIASYLGNRYWSFRDRQRTSVAREIVIFTVLNGIGLLIQDATVAFNYYVLHLGHDKLAGFIALNFGIVLATLFRFWSYRQFVWVAPPGGGARHAEGRPWPADRPPQTAPTPNADSTHPKSRTRGWSAAGQGWTRLTSRGGAPCASAPVPGQAAEPEPRLAARPPARSSGAA